MTMKNNPSIEGETWLAKTRGYTIRENVLKFYTPKIFKRIVKKREKTEAS